MSEANLVKGWGPEGFALRIRHIWPGVVLLVIA
jgi:hypothetical protein